ncbi:MAG: DUF2344 domain-containing protein [Elusimicrobiota bacterium]|jgi:hypothetical protein|nr:DUF2344 domain-containing protein [Elusimicrobiota bacterium]
MIKEAVYKYRIKFSKCPVSITSHEMRRMIKDAIANSGLKYAQRKNHPRFNLGPVAGAGEASLCEYADICLLRESGLDAIASSLAPHIIGGYKIEDIKEIPFMLSSVEFLADFAMYNIKGVKADIEKFSACRKIECETEHDNGIKEIKNIRPFIYSVKLNGDEVEIIIKLDVLRALSMRQILMKLPGFEVDEHKLEILRLALFWQNGRGALVRV